MRTGVTANTAVSKTAALGAAPRSAATKFNLKGVINMTTNKYWIYLENLRQSGITNMFGASPYLAEEFDISEKEANVILADWMRNYNPEDYE